AAYDPGPGAGALPQIRSCGRDIPVGSCRSVSRHTDSATAIGVQSACPECQRPTAQGAGVVLENKTGRVLAMTGGFSYPLSQLNRATQAQRQPGSAIKPLSYLAALGKGLQPNTLISDEPITLPPIGGRRGRDRDYWTPKNYDGGSKGTLTLRSA